VISLTVFFDAASRHHSVVSLTSLRVCLLHRLLIYFSLHYNLQSLEALPGVAYTPVSGTTAAP